MKHLTISKTGIWTVRLVVPVDAREALGKREFKKSLGQLPKDLAASKANRYLAEWHGLIHRARAEKSDTHFTSLQELEIDSPRSTVRQQARQSLIKHGGVGYPTEQQEISWIKDRLDTDTGISASESQVSAYFGYYCIPASFIDEYTTEQLEGQMKERSKDEHVSVLRSVFEKDFVVIDGKFTLRAVEKWWSTKSSELAPSTLTKYKSHCSTFMDWLIRHELTDRPNHFTGLKVSTKRQHRRKGKTEARKPFTDSDIIALWNALHSAKKLDRPLINLFLMALYTGCRIEELCQLKDTDIKQGTNGRYYIDIPVSKTQKGEDRHVPLHRMIEPLVLGKKGYLIDIQKVGQRYGERSSAIGKRFGRLKTAAGFGADKVFHSLRKSFIDKLYLVETPEQFAADIVGHEKQTMTYGVYASGSPVERLFGYVDAVTYTELEAQIVGTKSSGAS